MDNQRVHLRSVVDLTQALLDPPGLLGVPPELELVAGPERLRIVGNRIEVNDVFLRGHHVILVAETIASGSAGDLFRSELVNQVAGPEQDGIPGHPMTVVAGRLTGGRGTTRGQKGGTGEKGLDGVDMPPIVQPIPQPPFPQGPPPKNGRSGGNGGPGGDGGPGGPVTVTLKQASNLTGGWSGVGGFKGPGGEGGAPEAGNITGSNGEPGLPGADGDPGVDVPATVRVVDAAGFLSAVTAALAGGPDTDWKRLRQELAEELFRRSDVVGALEEFDGVLALKPFEPALSDQLPELVRDQRTLSGVARDQELVPDVAHHARAYRVAAGVLREIITVAGSLLNGDTQAAKSAIKSKLDEVARLGGRLDDQISELGTAVKLGLEALEDLTPRTNDTLDRLETVLGDPSVSPLITVAGNGPQLNASAVAGALAGLLGAHDTTAAAAPAADSTLILLDDDQVPPVIFTPSADVVTLLPADLELVVHRSLRNRRHILGLELVNIRNHARGLAGFADWGLVRTGATDSSGVPVTVDLGRVAADLRAATGSRPVLDLLIELAEITHGWRLARARIEQQLATRTTMTLRRKLATRARDRFVPDNPDPTALLPGLRCLLDWLAWFGERADRAVDIVTFGLTRPAPVSLSRFPTRPELVEDRAQLSPLLYSPDWALELAEKTPQAISGGELDSIATALLEIDHRPLRQAYLERGFAFVDDEPSYHEVTFTRAARPDVFARLNAVGNFWFDLSLADLAGDAGKDPQVEARVVGAGIVVGFDALAPASFGMNVVHYGLSVQRDLADQLHRQVMLPTSIPITLGSDCGSGNCAEASGETRLTVGKEIDFPPYGRGAAAGWLVQAANLATDFSEATSITVRIFHEAMVPDTAVSLRSVSFAGGALRVGSVVPVVVRLTAAAPADGAFVFLTSSEPSVISVPGAAVVAAGQTEGTALATVLAPTGPRLPVLSARTKDGVTRTVRATVPVTAAPVVSSVRLVSDQPATVTGLAVLPGAGRVPAEVLATVTLALAEVGQPQPPGRLKGRNATDLGARRETELGDQPRSLAVDTTRKRIYVVNNSRGPASLAMLDAVTLKKLAEQPIGPSIDVAVDPAGGLVYVSEFNGGLRVFAADDLTPRETITDDDGRLRRPNGLAVVPGSAGGADIYIARLVRGIPDVTEDAAVTRVVRLPNGEHRVARSVTIGPPLLQPVDVAVDVPSQLVFVSCLGGGGVHPELVVLRHASLTEVSRVRLPRTGRAVATRPGSGMAYVVGEEGLSLIDGVSGTLAATIPLGGGLPLSVAVDPATGTAYVGMRDDGRLIRLEVPASAAPVRW